MRYGDICTLSCISWAPCLTTQAEGCAIRARRRRRGARLPAMFLFVLQPRRARFQVGAPRARPRGICSATSHIKQSAAPPSGRSMRGEGGRALCCVFPGRPPAFFPDLPHGSCTCSTTQKALVGPCGILDGLITSRWHAASSQTHKTHGQAVGPLAPEVSLPNTVPRPAPLALMVLSLLSVLLHSSRTSFNLNHPTISELL